MGKLLIGAALGIGMLWLAPSTGHASAFSHPSNAKALVDQLQMRPRLAQAGRPDAPSVSRGDRQGSGDASRGRRSGGGDSARSSRSGGDSRAYRGGGDDRRWRGPRPDGYGWRGPGPRYVGPGRHYYRPWSRRPYYGSIFGGIVLGTIIGVAIVGVVPPSPDPDLCWYWADPYRSRGYWDYCD